MFKNLQLWIKQLWSQIGTVFSAMETKPIPVKRPVTRKKPAVKKTQPVLAKKKPAVKKTVKK